jgi:2-polyprenyl-6-methoxyphenol hydroxylase-like FAD-dependent oxidoreductase
MKKRLAIALHISLVQKTTAFGRAPSSKLWQLSHRRRFSSALHSSAVMSSAAQEAEGTWIVGGGLGGLASAAALYSIANVSSIKVLEAASKDSFSSDKAGAAVQLTPNGLRALKAIGGAELLNSICEAGTKLTGSAMIGQDGNIGGAFMTTSTVEEDTGLPVIMVRWGVLRSLLHDVLPKNCVEVGTGSDIVGYSLRDEGELGFSKVLPIDKNGDDVMLSSCSKTPPLLLGADGLNSVFKRCVHADTQDGASIDRYSHLKDGGRVNIKAVIPVDLGPEFTPETTYSYFSPCFSTACFCGPAGKGFTYWAISIGDDGDGNQFIQSSEQDDTQTAKKRLLAKLTDVLPDGCQFFIDLIKQTEDETILVRRSEETCIENMSLMSKDGRVVLVGDAAHAMSASYGQASSFAFEDAATLATCIARSQDLRSALNEYSAQRLERVAEMNRRSSERAAKAMKGETAEDVSKWIHQWDINSL